MLVIPTNVPQNKRIFIVTECMDEMHGTEMLAATLIQALHEEGWEVELFTARHSGPRSLWHPFLKSRQVRVHHPHFWKLTRHLLPQRAAAWLLRRRCRQKRPALIWSPDNEPLTLEALQSMPPGAPPFFVHDPNEAGPAFPHYQNRWFDVCHRAAGLSVHGGRQQVAAQAFCQLARPAGVVWPASFPPGQSFQPPVPRPGRPVRFGLFGRFHAQKGHLFAIAALHEVIRQGHDAELHLFGDGDMRFAIEDLTASLGLRDRVVLHGRYLNQNLDQLIAQVDAGLMPSIYEGFGLVMLELMSRCRPVIATDVGSSREVLEGLGGGWVVPRADTGALAGAMIHLCKQPGLITTKGREAADIWSRHFTPAEMLHRYLAFWRAGGASL